MTDKKYTDILQQERFSRADLLALLDSTPGEHDLLVFRAAGIKEETIGNKVFFRGLVELSNICSKNCYYCGVRAGNSHVARYTVSEDEVVEAAIFAHENRFASLVLQSGERSDAAFVGMISRLLKKIHKATNNNLHITLSLGEQSPETYKEWYELGAQRYLLRIETSSKELYKKLHPGDERHDYARRLECLQMLKDAGYQVGTGVMVGLPFQTLDDLVNDLLFMKEFDIDMVGMGPYVEHEHTPLYEYRHLLPSPHNRLYLSLRMVALLRIIIRDINIAATTAMQTLSPEGRELALKAGANVIMPNLTPLQYRDNYLLYNNKPGTKDQIEDSLKYLEKQIAGVGHSIAFNEWGDSQHYSNRINKDKN